MTPKEFTEKCLSTAIYPYADTGQKIEFMYLGLGAASEAGEVAGKISKYHRDGYMDPDALIKECGDTLYFLSLILRACNCTFEECFDILINKLEDRKERNVLSGSGDNR